MSSTTLCPTCHTRFKVSEEQLQAHQGLVRCGRCQAVFNATEYQQDDEQSPQLDLLMEEKAEQPAETGAPPPEETTAPTSSAGTEEHEPSLAEEARYEWHDPEAPADNAPATTSLAQAVDIEETASAQPVTPAKQARQWPWIAGSALMVLLLLAQAAYFYRVEIAAQQPGLKPALVAYSGIFGGSVPLPQKTELMSIESSYLEADPVQSSVITLNALLRNHGNYAQAYPQLELTLTDAQDKPLARRIFRPADYLKADTREEAGLMANRELAIKLNLDTADLKPSGYRLLLFYAQ